MKKILLALLLSIGLVYGQQNPNRLTYTVQQVQQLLDQVGNNGTTIDGLITDMGNSQNKDHVQDTTLAYILRLIAELQGSTGGGGSTPSLYPLAAYTVQPLSTTTGSAVGVFQSNGDSVRIWLRIQNSSDPYVVYDTVDSLDFANGYTFTGLSYGTVYQSYSQVGLDISGTFTWSSASAIDTMLTATPPPPTPDAYNLYVDNQATGSGDGSEGSPMTLAQAITASLPGYVIKVDTGAYNIPLTGINFSHNGTASQPITWVGSLDATDYYYNTTSIDKAGINSSVFYNGLNTSNGSISLSGDHNIFRKIGFQQDITSKQIMSIGGDGVKLDSCTVKYPSNATSSSNHLVVVTGDSVTIQYTTFKYGPRCIIWVRKDPSTSPNRRADNFTLDHSILTGSSNHPPIQIMPATNSTDTTTIKHTIVSNCTFIDNTYTDGIYSRYLEQFAFFNNKFIRSSTPYSVDIHTGFHYPTGTPADTCNSKGGIIAYNTIVENNEPKASFNKGSNQIHFVNNIFYSSMSAPDIAWRHDGDWNAIYRHEHDYNLYYYTAETMGGVNSVRGTWGTGNTSVWWDSWTTTTGQESHSVVNQDPLFTSLGTDDLTPMITSPALTKGKVISKANGYWMDILTDFNGDTRSETTPTIGAIENPSGGMAYPQWKIFEENTLQLWKRAIEGI